MNLLRSIFIFPIHLVLQLSNMGFWGGLIIIFGLIRFLLPIRTVNKALLKVMHRLYFTFAIISVAMIKIFNRIEIRIDIDEPLNKQKWYLITANHISYLDIILLIDFCAPRIPPPKFFLKKELIWLPFVGLAAWAMDMPFMRRYSQSFLQKHPHLKGKDIEATRRSCEKFVDTPTTVINFVEGTRFTLQKHAERKSPYSHLLRPKAGGIAFTLTAMGELFSNILDITIAYPNTRHPMMDMLSGRMTTIIIDVKTIELSNELIGNYFENEHFKNSFQVWINKLWHDKNKRMQQWMN
ncbi:acyltransferase [Glaciecola petra]|uniref:Acyltransferase n=1 Tax=Glaciecola petra TaxID=3075602 RepID=A0ABU2ZW50_9ALTE|nr:acyltransferase [Aestuariibacter sp. P117]MDT0596529.1 acyltransferase [Aestuariibacter sp. P117]